MSGRRLLGALGVLTLLVTACGDDGATVTTAAPATTAAATTSTSSGATTTTSTIASSTTTTPPTTTTAPPTTTTTTQPADPVRRIEVTLSGGDVIGGVQRAEVDLGSEVMITVFADVADEVHVHGYDLFGDVDPDYAAEIEFTADIPGIFEVELEGSHALILELEVS